jgi:hypothetical protein
MNFNDTFYLKKAGEFANALDSNACLPIVYGDLTDGVRGNWILPCINTVTFVYCFAAHAVQTVANGNAINIYADDVLVAGGDYTFNASDSSYSNYATITFVADRGNAVISARGNGKAPAGTLLENIVDVINDFLTVENDFSSTNYNAATKAFVYYICDFYSYKAAGIINKDEPYWTILKGMVSSFLGDIYIDGNNKLTFIIDNNKQYSHSIGVLPKSEFELNYIEERDVNIINQCPCEYAHDYVRNIYKGYDESLSNTISQNIYGIKKPKESYQFLWCRDLTTVQEIEAIIIDKFKFGVIELGFSDKTLKRHNVDVNDLLEIEEIKELYNSSGQYFKNQLFKITTIQPDFEKKDISFQGYWISSSSSSSSSSCSSS